MVSRGSDTLGVGDRAPDFTLHSSGGNIITLSEYRGTETMVLYFFRGTW